MNKRSVIKKTTYTAYLKKNANFSEPYIKDKRFFILSLPTYISIFDWKLANIFGLYFQNFKYI